MITSAFRVYEKEIHPRKSDNSQIRPRDGSPFQKKKMEDNTPVKKQALNRPMPSSHRQANPYNFGMPQNNININVNNLIINNNQNANFPYPNNYGVYLSNSSVFSKLGSDIVGKGNMNNNKNKKRPFANNYSPNKKNSFDSNRNEPNVEKVIANLIEVTKEKPSDLNEQFKPNKESNDENKPQSQQLQHPHQLPNQQHHQSQQLQQPHQLPNQQHHQAQSQNQMDNKDKDRESLVSCSDEILNLNVVIWESLFDFEINVDSRQILSVAIKRCLHFLSEHIQYNMNKPNPQVISFDIFSSQSLNAGYNKLIKISIVMLIYLKYILLDFNYEMTLKSNVKKIANSINMYLLAILENCVFATNNDKENNKENNKDSTLSSSKNMAKMSTEFKERYKKIGKIHHTKKTKETINQFGSSLMKNIEIAINHIKQMSANYFKIGYFKFIHNICFEFFRLIDNYSAIEIAQLTINNILFYVIHNNLQDKHNSQSVTNQQIVFNPTSLMGICGFGNNVSAPFLPPAKDNAYTLVLDLDDTLVHFFYTPSGGTFLIRPGCFEFLDEMSQCFEIVVFTAAMKDYADSILNLMDPENKFIKYRLYRHHTSISGVSFVKDLTKLGRDLSKVIIIDNLRDNFKLQPNNGLEIKTWCEEIRDNQLKDIKIMLQGLLFRKPNDIRVILKKLKVEITKRMKKNNISPYANIDIEKFNQP